MPVKLRSKSRAQSVLISGAGIAGSATAYWLERFGFEVTVVERTGSAANARYPVDVRGAAIEVVERMGALSRLRAARTHAPELRFVNADGNPIAPIAPEDLIGEAPNGRFEVRRSALISALQDLTHGREIRHRFEDSIETLRNAQAGVDVRFRSGAEQRFDIVIGADGTHSITRALALGPKAPVNRYVSFCLNLLFDNASQRHPPRWSAGRVTLVGDAAHTPSFLSRKGSSFALVGAYLLAGELAAHADPTDAFASYERMAWPFMKADQKFAFKAGGSLLMPRVQEGLEARDAMLAALQTPGDASSHGEQRGQINRALKLPDYTRLIAN